MAFAIFPEIVPSEIKFINLDKFSGLIGLSLISRLFSFKSANNSPVIQFADNFTSDFSITFSKYFDVSRSETKIVAS